MAATQSKARSGSYFLDTLLDFEARPGRYSLVLREPHVLFDNPRKLFTLCLGRAVEGEPLDEPQMLQAQRAACFFVRTALMRSSSDHYTLMGVQPGFREETLRDHYRLLMRLTHPDYASSASQWPADAATRINRANEVLSSPVQRAQYDQELAGVAPVPRPAPRPSPEVRRVVVPSAAPSAKTPVAYWAIPSAIVAVCLVIFVVLPASEGTKFMTDTKHVVVVAQADSEKSTHQQVENSPPKPEVKAAPQSSPLPEPVKVLAPAPVEVAMPPVQQVAAAAAPTAREIKLEKAAQKREAAKLQEAVVQKQTRPAVVVAAVEPTRVVTPTPATLRAEPRLTLDAAAPVTPAPEPVKIEEKATPQLGLADTQTQMNQIIQAMQSGNGQNLMKAVERSAAGRSEGVNALVRVYNHMVGESRQIKLGAVQLRSRNDAERLIVEGLIPLYLQDQGSPPPVREIRMRAVFVQRAGQVVMTQIGPGGSAQ